jgi:hypothetical protein
LDRQIIDNACPGQVHPSLIARANIYARCSLSNQASSGPLPP